MEKILSEITTPAIAISLAIYAMVLITEKHPRFKVSHFIPSVILIVLAVLQAIFIQNKLKFLLIAVDLCTSGYLIAARIYSIRKWSKLCETGANVFTAEFLGKTFPSEPKDDMENIQIETTTHILRAALYFLDIPAGILEFKETCQTLVKFLKDMSTSEFLPLIKQTKNKLAVAECKTLFPLSQNLFGNIYYTTIIQLEHLAK